VGFIVFLSGLLKKKTSGFFWVVFFTTTLAQDGAWNWAVSFCA